MDKIQSHPQAVGSHFLDRERRRFPPALNELADGHIARPVFILLDGLSWFGLSYDAFATWCGFGHGREHHQARNHHRRHS
jgi:hypothetical protein